MHECILMILCTVTQDTALGCIHMELPKEVFSFVDVLLPVFLEDTKILESSCGSEDCFPPLDLDCAGLLGFAQTPRGIAQHASFQRLPSATSVLLPTDLSDLLSLRWFECPWNPASGVLVYSR